VYIHGLVRDENNRKMSKSAGNGIDPLPLIERYGADALRFALVREVTGAGQDIRLDYDRAKGSSATVESARNFANKLWNATRFALMNLEGETPTSLGEPGSRQAAAGRPLDPVAPGPRQHRNRRALRPLRPGGSGQGAV
jgi:valyl-tRNA synthetase